MFTTNFKGPRVSEKVRRRRKRERRDKRTRDNKQKVRDRDNKRTRRGCRFAGDCGCRRHRQPLEVAHLEHQGMGGNPKEDRNLPEKMIQVCEPRHKGHAFSLDKKTLKCEPVDEALGTNGPVAWFINVDELLRQTVEQFVDIVQRYPGMEWIPLSFETPNNDVIEIEPVLLEWLAEMKF